MVVMTDRKPCTNGRFLMPRTDLRSGGFRFSGRFCQVSLTWLGVETHLCLVSAQHAHVQRKSSTAVLVVQRKVRYGVREVFDELERKIRHRRTTREKNKINQHFCSIESTTTFSSSVCSPYLGREHVSNQLIDVYALELLPESPS